MVNSFSLDFLRITPDMLTRETGYIRYDHTEKNQSGTADPSFEGVSLLLYIPRSVGARRLYVNVYNEALDRVIFKYEAKLTSRTGDNDVFDLTLKAGELDVGLYFFDLPVEGIHTLIGGKLYNNKIIFKRPGNATDKFQLTVFEPTYNAPTRNLGGIIYHIFVDRFARSGEVKVRKDAVMVNDWYSEIPEFPAYPGAFLKNNTFFGGTLYGVIDKLDYLSSLGVSTIYLSPIFEAYSNHKYDTGNYAKVDEMFGGDEAFEKLIKEARSRGIGIILDGVFNHTGSDSIYFNKNGRYDTVGAYQSTDSKYYSWFDFQSHPNKYTCWWGIEILPRINPDKPSCRDFFIGDNGIISKYAKMGIDGFRLDVADELSDDFIAGIKSALNDENNRSILYGEVWEDASNKIAYSTRKKYYLGKELDGVMNYPIRDGIIDYILNKNTHKLSYALNEVYPNMPKRVRDAAMNLLGTHDTERILTKLSGASAHGLTNAELRAKRLTREEYKKGSTRLKSAYTVIATLPGIPSIYYSDEVGAEGYSDPFNRRPFPWGREDNNILDHYKRVGAIRRSSSVYADGEFEVLELTDSLLAFKRYNDEECILTVYNNSNRDITISFDESSLDLINEKAGKQFVLKKESALIFATNSKNSFNY